jgi:hypothetical protein
VALRHALDLALEEGDNRLAASCLENLALAAAARDAVLAARLLGAAHTVQEEVGLELDDDAAAAIRSAAGDELCERAYAEGRELSLREAAAVALRDADVIQTDRAPA